MPGKVMFKVETVCLWLSVMLFSAGLYADDPGAVLAAFKQAMQADDATAAAELLDINLTVYEQGYVERSRDEYLSGHFHDDAKFTNGTRQEVLNQSSGISGDQAWITTDSRTLGDYRGKKVDSMGTETILLHKVGESWQIHHIHWSSHKTRSVD
jgi:ketosteroid isomerase-like protein